MPDTYCINCGAPHDLVDAAGTRWRADCHFTGGLVATREQTLPIHHTATPDLYRSERYNVARYAVPVENGTYLVRLHFAETFDCNHVAGGRSFDVHVNGRPVVEHFDPYRAANGFACPAVIEVAGCVADHGLIEIVFTNAAVINALEIVATAAGTPACVRQISAPLADNETFIGTRQAAAPDARTRKMLFIGNSMTFFWAIPESVQVMLEIGTRDLRIEPARSLHGGKNLAFHYDHTDAGELIKHGGFAWVVLQEGSDAQAGDAHLFFEYATKFDQVIRAHGAQTLLYAQPAPRATTDAQRRQIMRQHAVLSQKLKAPLVPACETVRRCYERQPELILHNEDAVHMGLHGGYAVACTFYAALTGRAAFPPPAGLVQQVAIAPDVAAFIQEQALAAVRDYCGCSASFML